jgi:hypothetical protein
MDGGTDPRIEPESSMQNNLFSYSTHNQEPKSTLPQLHFTVSLLEIMRQDRGAGDDFRKNFMVYMINNARVHFIIFHISNF